VALSTSLTASSSSTALLGNAQQWLSVCQSLLCDSKDWVELKRDLQIPTSELTYRMYSECFVKVCRFEYLIHALRNQQRQSDMEEAAMFSKIRHDLRSLKASHRQHEHSRRNTAALQRHKARRWCAMTWRWILRSLANERGPWSTYLNAPEHERPKIYWKLDESETQNRMRPKLRVNYHGTDHKDAKHSLNTNISLAELLRQQAEAEELLKTQLKRKELKEAEEPDAKDEEDLVEGKEDEQDSKVVQLIKEEPVYATECQMINISGCMRGELTLTTTHIYFEAKPEPKPAPDPRKLRRAEQLKSQWEIKDRKWPLAELSALHYRRSQLRRVAMELFFSDHSNYFFRFESEAERNKVCHKITRLLRPYLRARPRAALDARSGAGGLGLGLGTSSASRTKTGALNVSPLDYYNISSKNPAETLRRSGLTLAWQQRKISNFDYLMHLNTIAGRTYNDLSQYPVFPWIIADYESTALDLHDPEQYGKVYRDLRKPVGALNPDRLQGFLERYHGMEGDPSFPKFHYGTHYSNAGIVLFYLLRMEPFTTQAIQLQDGKFDHPDRMFHSIPAMFRGCLTNPADVKELIPEFFYLAEFLRNANELDLGVCQSGQALGDVILPPWAATPEDFVRIQREALESEYVSQNLHHWIDLIFGYKQRGKDAEEAHNVFFYLTYEHADLEADASKLAQIDNFGQTPSQILTTPHPSRFAADDSTTSIFRRLQYLHLYSQETVTARAASDNPLLFISHASERILSIGLDQILSIHKWRNSTPEYVPPFYFEMEKSRSKPRRVGVHFAVGLNILPFFFALSHCEKYLLSCGHWDNSFRCSVVDTGVNVQSISQHKDIVTCMALSETGDVLVTGSKDTTVMVWEVGDNRPWSSSSVDSGLDSGLAGSYINASSASLSVATGLSSSASLSLSSSSSSPSSVPTPTLDLNKANSGLAGGAYINERPKHILYGHDDEVTCVAVNADFDLVVSGSKDGTCILHTCRKGRYVRSVYPPNGGALRWVGISSEGYIVTHSLADCELHLFDINGRHLHSASTHEERLYAFMFSNDGQFLITGGDHKQVVVRAVHNLQIVHKFPAVPSTIRCLTSTPNEQHLLVGLQNGQLLIYALHYSYLRQRFIKRLGQLGF